MIRKRLKLRKPVDGWILPILVGQARRLAKNPPTSAWGKSMHAKRGGYAVQQNYRMEGRNPTEKATYARQYNAGSSSARRAENELDDQPVLANQSNQYDPEIESILESFRQQKRELHQQYSERVGGGRFFADEY